MNNPSSPTPPPSPESLPSSSDDYHEFPRDNPNFAAMSPASTSSSSPALTSSASLALSSMSSSVSSASVEATSSTGYSSPQMISQDSLQSASDGTFADESSILSSEFPVAMSLSMDQCPSSSKSKSETADTFSESCSTNNFSSEVSSSDMDVDVMPYASSSHMDISSLEIETGYHWVPDSSEGATGSSFPQGTLQDIPPSLIGETIVSRSTWHVNSSKNDTKSETSSTQWTSEMYAVSAEASYVSSTGPPDSDKLADKVESCDGWSAENSNSHMGEPTASTSSSWSREQVNSSIDVESPSVSWCQNSEEGAVGLSYRCDSPNSAAAAASASASASAASPNISPSPSSTTLGASLSPSPWPPPLSTNSGATAGISSSTQHCPTNSSINSTSVSYGEVPPQMMSWRTRASSSPIRLTRVAPTTPPPRPPTPPCPSTPNRTRAMHNQYSSSPGRSASPQDRLHSPSTVRRSVSPPIRHYPPSTPPTQSRRSVSPPLRGRGLTQRLASPRRSVSPNPLQQPLAQPPSPSGRHRLSPRPRSARTPSPRPPRPPNSTPEPSPSPSQHSPRPHHAKMRGR